MKFCGEMLAFTALISSSSSIHAVAQQFPAWHIEVVGGPVSPSNPVVKVVVSTSFPVVTSTTAYAAGTFDLLSSDNHGFFFGTNFGSGLSGSCTNASTLGEPTQAGGVSGVGIQQLNLLGCIANPENPIEIWTAEWTTADFSGRTVSLSTANTYLYNLYEDLNAPLPGIFYKPEEIIHGSAVIQVIPAPGAFALLLAGAGLTTRRRR